MKKELLMATALVSTLGAASVAQAVTASATEAAPSVDTRAVPINSSFFIITPFELMNIH